MGENTEFVILQFPDATEETVKKLANMLEQEVAKVFPDLHIMISSKKIETVSKEEIKQMLSTLGLEVKDNGVNRS